MKKAKTTRKKKAKKTKSKTVPKPRKSGDLPVTQKMLSETKQELKSDITSVHLDLKAFRSESDSRFKTLESKIEQVLSVVHKTNALVEEQNTRNKFVLDGYTSLHHSNEEIKKRLDKIESESF